MKIKKLAPKIYHVYIKDRVELSKHFMRFQEHYESPKFRDKTFSVREFKEWYRTTRKHGKFSYNTDWSGFNIPCYVLQPFYEGFFNPLTNREKVFLNKFKSIYLTEPKFYIIGTSDKDFDDTLNHELAHAFYYVNPNYRRSIQSILASTDAKAFHKWLKSRGYCKEVYDDETQAYLINDADWLEEIKKVKLGPAKKSVPKLQKVFKRYIGRINGLQS